MRGSKCRRAEPRRWSSAAAGTIRAVWRWIARATFLWPIAGRAGCWKYRPDSGSGRLLEVPSGSSQTVTVAGGFGSPIGIAVDAAGGIFVADARDKLGGGGARGGR